MMNQKQIETIENEVDELISTLEDMGVTEQDCGCIYDSLNRATLVFCEIHMMEHERRFTRHEGRAM